MSESGPMAAESLGALLARLRTAQGKSQLRIAELLCAAAGAATVTRHEVSRWEREERVPSGYWLRWLAVVLDASLDDLERAAAASRALRVAAEQSGSGLRSAQRSAAKRTRPAATKQARPPAAKRVRPSAPARPPSPAPAAPAGQAKAVRPAGGAKQARPASQPGRTERADPRIPPAAGARRIRELQPPRPGWAGPPGPAPRLDDERHTA
jgi:transcriptional regulator with XRE-family HTH domain